MATTTPPPRTGPGPLPPSDGPPGPPRPTSPPPSGVSRWVAVGALALVVAVVAYLVFGTGGGASYKFALENDSQLVLGDQVEVGGVPVGSVTAIGLTPHSYKALITIHVSGSLVPLHRGTTAQVRVPSLTTVAGRYVELSPGPNNAPALPAGSTLPASAGKGTTDLDQIFDTLGPRTRKGLQEFFVGQAEQYAGAEQALGIDTEYFGPFIASADHIFAELGKDQRTFTNFLVYSAKALTILGAHHKELTELVSNGDQGLEALGAEQASLQKGVAQLPVTLRQGNQTFAQLPAAFTALRQLAQVAGPDTKTLPQLFARLEPLVREAGPVLHNVSLALSKPGPSNDLTDSALAMPLLAQELVSGSPSDVKFLRESVPVTAYFGPYAPDLQGFVRTFGTSAGYYDADGQYARISAVFNNFKTGPGNTLVPTTPQEGLQGLHTHELRRCPGSGATPSPADGSAPFTDEGKLECNPAQVP